MQRGLLFILILAGILPACKTSKKAESSTNSNSKIIADDLFRKPIRDKQLYLSTNDAVPIEGVYTVKDTLHIITKKIIGCSSDDFKLVWNGDFGKTLPPQTGVKLLQVVNGTLYAKASVRPKF